MSAQDCIDAIRAAAGDLTDDEIEEIVGELQRRMRMRAGRSLLGEAETLAKAADDIIAEQQFGFHRFRRNISLNMAKIEENFAYANTIDDQFADPSLGVQAKTVGINKRVEGARSSAAQQGHALEGIYLGGLITDLEDANLLRAFGDDTMAHDIAAELAELSKPDGNVGISGNRDARKVAKIVRQYQEAARARSNRAGADIGQTYGFITTHHHSGHRMRKAGYEAWRDFILPRLDHERTFDGAEPDKFLRGAYEQLISGVSRINRGAESDVKFKFVGPSSLAKRVSHHRVLHFKDATGWVDYNAAYGTGSLSETIISDLASAAHNTALMEVWGPNPRYTFDQVLDRLKKQHRADPRKLARLNRRGLVKAFDQIEGVGLVPDDPRWSNFGAAMRAFVITTKLGGATLSAIADLGFKAFSISQSGGHNVLGVWRTNLTSTLEGMASRDARRTAGLMGVGLDTHLGHIISRFTSEDPLPGNISRLLRLYFKLNLLGPWTDASKRGAAAMWARELAFQSRNTWDSIDPGTRTLLTTYGFNANKWEVARKAIAKDPSGRSLLTADAVLDLPDEAFAPMSVRPAMSKADAARFRDELATQLNNYFVDRSEEAVPTPGARERSIVTGGTRPGSPIGEAIRFVTLFSSFPITASIKGLGRATQADTIAEFIRLAFRNRADGLALAHLIAATTVMGYLAMSAKNIARGQTPRDPSERRTWQAAFLQGGGAGLFGDFMFGEFNRFGRSFPQTAIGPVFGGPISDIATLWATVMQGDQDVGATALRLALRNTPFLNLFYVRSALDYLVLYQLQEMASPGFLRRMERRVANENAQRFLIPPSQTIPRGGGSRALEGVR